MIPIEYYNDKYAYDVIKNCVYIKSSGQPLEVVVKNDVQYVYMTCDDGTFLESVHAVKMAWCGGLVAGLSLWRKRYSDYLESNGYQPIKWRN